MRRSLRIGRPKKYFYFICLFIYLILFLAMSFFYLSSQFQILQRATAITENWIRQISVMIISKVMQ